LGIKRLKQNYTPQPYMKKDESGTPIPRHEVANFSAKQLKKYFWTCQPPTGNLPTTKIRQNNGVQNTHDITIEELKNIIGKSKRNKATGIDRTPMELYKELDEKNLLMVLKLINKWWNEEQIPEHILLAEIILIFKKGDNTKITNYRPIALLNTLYKIFASLLKSRLARTLDKHLQETQFGFRRKKGTADALHCIRRAIEFGEKTNNPAYFVLLDWEKAFDKVTHEALFNALDRMGTPDKFQNLIKQLYKNTNFRIQHEDTTSDWHKQDTGIRQGCPLSPYLFLIVMTVLFHDIKNNADLQEELKTHRIPSAEFDEILYADDTILVSTHVPTLNTYIKFIELEGKKIGMKLNPKKTEALCFNKKNPGLKFANGKPIPSRNEVDYLGAKLNAKGDPNKELNIRKNSTIRTWTKLGTFFKHSNCPLSSK